MYSLDFLDLFHLSFSLQSPSAPVCGHSYIVYIYLRSQNHSLSDIGYLLFKIARRDIWVKEYIYNLQIRLRIINPCHRTGQRCKLQ